MSDDRPTGRWTAVNDIFHRALEVPEGRRRAFVVSLCRDDARLRTEVLGLLDAHERASGFLERASGPDVAARGPGNLVGQAVGHYHVLDIVGLGGMGIVYRAMDTRLGREVALKAVSPAAAGNAARRERLRREARAAARLNHPGIATVYALEEIAGHLYIASELVAGETLRAELARGPQPSARVVETARAIAVALAAAHDQGIVHRDLKPDNVMRTPAGGIKILDFGLAKLQDDSDARTLTADGSVLGTPAYMSPEQIRAEPVDGRTDLFALGVMLYELASGQHPFASGDASSTIARILEREPPALAVADMKAPWPASALAALNEVIRRCLSKRLDGRYASAREVLDGLDDIGQPGPASRPAAPPLEPAAPSAASWWWQFHQIAVSGAYTAVLVVLWTLRDWMPERWALWLVLAGLVGGVSAVALRLHLLFAVRSYPTELGAQRRRTRPWLLGADGLFAAAVSAAGTALLADHQGPGLLLIAVALIALISFTTIEPATTRAAFGRE